MQHLVNWIEIPANDIGRAKNDVAKRLLDTGLLITVVGRPQGVTSKGGAGE